MGIEKPTAFFVGEVGAGFDTPRIAWLAQSPGEPVPPVTVPKISWTVLALAAGFDFFTLTVENLRFCEFYYYCALMPGKAHIDDGGRKAN